MYLKAFITACISTLIISFPQNIIGCGPEADPYDYYTSFFHQDLPEARGYRPFYYTGYQFLYDTREPASVPDILASEWAAYCGVPVKDADAKKLVNKFSWKDLNNLYNHIEKNQPLKIPDSVKKNSMTDYFIRSKDTEALGYILYSKQIEPYVMGGEVDWQPFERDSVKMSKFIKNGQQLYAVAKKDIFKLKYAYQFIRLAHYSERYNDAINWYDEYVTKTTTNSVLQPLSLALKAGALFRVGRQKEAVYLFSKVFSETNAKKVSNYMGFKWSVDSKAGRSEYLAMTKRNKEKADMLALFAMGSTNNELSSLEEIYKLDPGTDHLEVLVVREINKLEEKYLTPMLQKDKGGKAFYFSWTDANADSITREAGTEVKALATFLHDAAQSGKVKNAGLFEVAAAYAAYMIRDYASAKRYLEAANQMPMVNQKVKAQWSMTTLLVAINSSTKIDAVFEERLLTSFKWLDETVKNEKPIEMDYWQVQQWRNIYRNLMSEIIAKRYHEQGDLAKETLAIGMADHITKTNQGSYSYRNGIEFLRNNLVSRDVEKLYALLNDPKPSNYEAYLLSHNSVTKKEVIDFAGTSYLREYDYPNAIAWFKRSSEKSGINKNPFIDILYDREEQLPSDKNYRTTKLAFAQEMLKLEQETKQPALAAKAYYKLALGMYNMSYYGHTWELVQYFRSGSDGYYIPKDATAFQREYYGVFKAEEYFRKAMNLSTDKNFKARCLFMIAKCSQKQVPQPQYEAFAYNWEKYDEASKAYWPLFTNNKHFPQLVNEYSNTAFYKEALSRCSYLRDFVKKK